MRKIAGISILIALAVASMVILMKKAARTGWTEALAEATRGISAHELHLRTDTKSLMVQETLTRYKRRTLEATEL